MALITFYRFEVIILHSDKALLRYISCNLRCISSFSNVARGNDELFSLGPISRFSIYFDNRILTKGSIS